MNDLIEFKRGQVWMYKDNIQSKYLTKGVQSGTRPCLIISSDQGNVSSSCVTVLKITSQDCKSKLSINVRFINQDNEYNVVLCNQVSTINKDDLFKYIGTLSDQKMEEVEKAYLEANGMEQYADSANATLAKIERLISRLETCKGHKYMNENTADEKVRKVAERLEDLYKDLAVFYDKTAEEIMNGIDPLMDFYNRRDLGKVNISSENDDKREDPKENTETPKHKKSSVNRKRTTKWTKEKMEEFLSDKELLSPNEYANKYGYESIQKCMWLYYNIKYKYRDTYGEFNCKDYLKNKENS